MVTSNFTLSGEKLELVARLHSGKPVFDLCLINGDEIACEMPYSELISFCEALRSELEEISTYWLDAGRKVANFRNEWEKEEAEHGVSVPAVAEE